MIVGGNGVAGVDVGVDMIVLNTVMLIIVTVIIIIIIINTIIIIITCQQSGTLQRNVSAPNHKLSP